MKTKPEPFAVRGGRLFLEDCALDELAAGLDGRAAWVLGHAAIAGAIAVAGPVTVPLGAVGPPSVLAMLAAAGCWARVGSRHELELAREAGFEPARILAAGRVLEDGFLKDALTACVAVLDVDEITRGNAARIAAALGLPMPPPAGSPPELPADAFARCGGLLAPLLAGPPALALDAVWDARGAAPPEVQPEAPAEVLPLSGWQEQDAAPSAVTLDSLAGTGARPARLHGVAARGDWVLVPSDDSLALRGADAAHPPARTVMVRGGAWRQLDPRRFPAAD